ncbi:MAG: phenylacetate--CoA ligase family protein [Candidatus Helarchaeota archaeon]
MDIKEIKEHEHSPIWNTEADDMLDEQTLSELDEFDEELNEYTKNLEARSSYLKENIPRLLDYAKKHIQYIKEKDISKFANLSDFPTTDRSILAATPWKLVPDDLDYSKLIVYNTSGTTGEPVSVPQHPLSVAAYVSLIKRVLAFWDIKTDFSPDKVGIALVGYQKHTVTFPCTLKALNDTIFIKINLNEDDWREAYDSYRFLSDVKPEIMTGDPLSFSKLAHIGDQIDYPRIKPKALITTAVALTDGVRSRIKDAFQAPVIDFYSLTETGPIGYKCRLGKGYHILTHDIKIEVLNREGAICKPGEIGEITVTGGRNPYFPLIRYRTGDWGRINYDTCPCGDPMPRILDLEGREPVQFLTIDNKVVNNVDISAALKPFPILQFTFHQDSKRNCELRVKFAGGIVQPSTNDLKEAIFHVMGKNIPLRVIIDPKLGEKKPSGKVVPFSAEIPLFYE